MCTCVCTCVCVFISATIVECNNFGLKWGPTESKTPVGWWQNGSVGILLWEWLKCKATNSAFTILDEGENAAWREALPQPTRVAKLTDFSSPLIYYACTWRVLTKLYFLFISTKITTDIIVFSMNLSWSPFPSIHTCFCILFVPVHSIHKINCFISVIIKPILVILPRIINFWFDLPSSHSIIFSSN